MIFEGLIPSFLLTFREALEAALIVAIIVAYLKKVGKAELNRYVYLGSGKENTRTSTRARRIIIAHT